jgi:hypothetical protein
MDQEASRAKQLRQIDISIRMRAACERLSTDALRAHYRRLHARRERMVMGVIGEYESVHGTGIKGQVFDVTTLMVLSVSGVLQNRRDLAEWVAARGLRRAA